ncbi:MAG: bifunctional demethylmenaquinone methyltransferase/2-methoxy-6-polyprenyl-1,4-benzoquinol methylase UbiE [Cyclobacteriaceae bacterium]|nr:bifunctional demethylmenaquinone methyltransferase/2-methoxy-6-polyprenyl-1,4-benzoquinol methylase UbiE [Cyclobacteriaceae bacterium]
MEVVPYKNTTKGKKEQVAEMFNNISRKYDFLNHFLSLGIDVYWRKKAIGMLSKSKPGRILDIATGTGDFALMALRLHPKEVIGIDISDGMLEVGKEKILKKGLEHVIRLEKGDSENIHFEDNSFDASIVAFGVRNFENLEKGLKEIHRVLRPGAMFIVLEFSKPRIFPFKQIYAFYFKYILPKIGNSISKDTAAYSYLPESVRAFPDGNEFIEKLKEAGFKNTTWKPLTFGISSIYTGQK